MTDSADTDDAVALAVIGGSGLYRLFDPSVSTQRSVATPYGAADVTIGELSGRRTAFLPRHGATHSVAPHLINFRANVWALASLGVRAIVSSAAVGGVSPDYPPGTLALPDQFIDRTWGRADTFYDRGSVQHLAAADPFCPRLRAIAAHALSAIGEPVMPTGTVVVIQGPRFSTRAESVWFRAAGAHLVNMTLYPEVPLAAELNMGTVNLSFVTDSDAGPDPTTDALSDGPVSTGDEVSAELVFTRLRDAQPRIIAAIDAIVAAIDADYRPRELISPAEVAAVLGRAATERAAPGRQAPDHQAPDRRALG
jgi:5'-methylthioadenosine phosphorylase